MCEAMRPLQPVTRTKEPRGREGSVSVIFGWEVAEVEGEVVSVVLEGDILAFDVWVAGCGR